MYIYIHIYSCPSSNDLPFNGSFKERRLQQNPLLRRFAFKAIATWFDDLPSGNLT